MTEPAGDADPARRSHRIAGEVMVFQPVTILGVSHEGMQIEASFALQNDSLREFRLALGERSVVVRGRVVRCEIGELREGTVLYRCAVEFVDPTPHAFGAISDFISALDAPPRSVIDGELAGEK